MIAAHSGVPAALLDYGLRCHADQFTDALRDHPDDLAALEDYLTVVRTRTPSAGPDAMPGVLPNVIPSRLTARYDLHGASVCVDTGATSSAIALSVAEQYLATDELELALVLALDVGAHHPMRDGAPPSVRQGAFLLALARQSTARTHGWPVVARMQSDATGSAPSATAGPGGFHAATDVVALLSALAASTEEIPTLHLPKAPPRNQRSAKRTAGPLTRRYISRRIPAPPLPSAASRTSALPAKALVLTDHAPTATALAPLAAAVGSTLWCTDPDADLALRPGPMSALTAAVDRAEGRIRVVSLPNTWPAMPAPACTELHEQLFHALGHARRRDITGSLGVVVLSPSDHPHAALFTGLVPSLLADYPELPVRVVVSDAQQPIAALDLLVREWTSTDQATATWHSNGQRHRMCLVPAPLPPPGGAGPYPVIVASGGAGGVTSTLLAALAAVTPADERPEVWILGTTDPSRLPADILQAGQNDLPALRAELIAQALRDGASSVAEAAARADRLLAGRRAAQNLHHLRATVGSNRLHYLTCDITDRRATQDAAHRVTAHHDRIDLFLHAATRSRTAPSAVRPSRTSISYAPSKSSVTTTCGTPSPHLTPACGATSPRSRPSTR